VKIRTKEDEDQVKGDIRDIRNRTDKIMGDIHTINRILVLDNKGKIQQDLVNIITGSPKRAAVLFLTSNSIDGDELSKKINIDKRNLNKFLNPFLDKGYISDSKEGKKKLFKRNEVIDLITFDGNEVFKKLIREWEEGKGDT
jgi:hypothetical protein